MTERLIAVSIQTSSRDAQAADGSFPGQRLESVPHAAPFRFDRAQVERAAATLAEWAAAPWFADTPFGG